MINKRRQAKRKPSSKGGKVNYQKKRNFERQQAEDFAKRIEAKQTTPFFNVEKLEDGSIRVTFKPSMVESTLNNLIDTFNELSSGTSGVNSPTNKINTFQDAKRWEIVQHGLHIFRMKGEELISFANWQVYEIINALAMIEFSNNHPELNLSHLVNKTHIANALTAGYDIHVKNTVCPTYSTNFPSFLKQVDEQTSPGI